ALIRYLQLPSKSDAQIHTRPTSERFRQKSSTATGLLSKPDEEVVVSGRYQSTLFFMRSMYHSDFAPLWCTKEMSLQLSTQAAHQNR
ncbi:unnamed protein product, partial [Candidula unifasciata]